MAPSIAPQVPNYLRLAKNSAGARQAMPKRLRDIDCRQSGFFMPWALCGMAEAAAKMNCSPAAIGVAWNWRESTKCLRLRFQLSAPVFIGFHPKLRHGLPFGQWQSTPKAAEFPWSTLSASMPRPSQSTPAFSQVELRKALLLSTWANSRTIHFSPDIRCGLRGVLSLVNAAIDARFRGRK